MLFLFRFSVFNHEVSEIMPMLHLTLLSALPAPAEGCSSAGVQMMVSNGSSAGHVWRQTMLTQSCPLSWQSLLP